MKFKIQEDYLVETKQDIEKFINKFGQETYDLFNKSRDRLKNNGYSTDIIYYTNKVSKEELEDILSKLQRRLKTKQDDGNRSEEGIRGKYKYLGEKDGYKVYQPLDYLASVDLGYMSGWCTTGRYGHAGERDCKPSEENAKEHFDAYRNKGIILYYFLDSKTMEGKYAIAKYPRTLEVNQFINQDTYIISTNFELYNQEDRIDYKAIDKIPIELVKGLELKEEDTGNGLLIKDNILIEANKNLTSITIPNNVESIRSAFSGCKSLTSVTFGENSRLTSIGDSAFRYCSSLTSIEIPDSVTTIGNYVFSSCNSLTSIVIPSGVTSIGSYAFYGCGNLTNITIPSNVTSIGDYVFSACSNLRSVTFEENSQLKNIYTSVFSNCGSLINIKIPDSVISIGDQVFLNCQSLKSIIIPNSIISIGSNVFSNCRSLTSVTIPNSVKNIGNFVFSNCVSLTDIKIPTSVATISWGMFYNCSHLTKIEIPSSVISIGDMVFWNCSSLTDVYYSGTKENWDKIIIGEENEDLFTATIHYNSKLSESYIKEERKMEENKKQLNPVLWQNNTLKPQIKEKVEEIVDKFIEGLEEKKISLKIEDIEIVGSNANYNYTTDSDLDIHVVVDMGEYSEEKKELLKLIYEYYKSSFNDKYEIYIKGIPVELYIEDKDTKAISNGVYSVLKDEWVKFPEEIEKQDVDISSEFDYLLKEYNKIKEMGDKEKAEQLLDTLYFNRKRSLALYGEYGVDNLIFKKFRNYGYLEELKEFIRDEESKLLSLENLTDRFLESIM